MIKMAPVVSCTLLLLCTIPRSACAAFTLPDTGQTTCHETVDPFAEIPCTGTGQDGSYSINTMSYKDNGDGTVTDNNTGLLWQKDDDNQRYNWFQASGTFSATYNPSTADVCGSLNLGGRDGWRLPTKKELMSIVDFSPPYPGPAIASAFFPNTHGTYYWTSTRTASMYTRPWSVDFSTATTRSYDESSAIYVRCVRGEETPQALIDNGNGIVTDSRSRLMWQQGEPGAMPWGSALTYCEDLSLGNHSDWRLPNIKELESLMDDTRNLPTISTTHFPDAASSHYWSSTTMDLGIGWAWVVNFAFGPVNGTGKSSAYSVRCVRGGDSGAPVTLTVTKEGRGTGVVTADNGSLVWAGNTGTAGYSFGATFTLTPTPDDTSLFSGWSGCATTGAEGCTGAMIGDVAVTALFNRKPVRIARSTPAYFTTLQRAHDTAIGGDTIEAQGMEFPESLSVSKPLTLTGGFDGSYAGTSGFTSVRRLISKGGCLTVKNLVIKE